MISSVQNILMQEKKHIEISKEESKREKTPKGPHKFQCQTGIQVSSTYRLSGQQHFLATKICCVSLWTANANLHMHVNFQPIRGQTNISKPCSFADNLLIGSEKHNESFSRTAKSLVRQVFRRSKLQRQSVASSCSDSQVLKCTTILFMNQ